MSIYKFRILLESNGDDPIFRDVEIKSSQTFFDLHEIIVASFGFDNSQMASFYLSDEQWNKGREIALFDMNMDEEQEPILVMEKSILNEFITCVGAHLLYSYDFLNMRNFFIELIESRVKEEANTFFPRVIYSQGEAPAQTIEDAGLSEEEMANQLLRDAGFDEEVDDDDDDMFEGFDDFENYQ